MWCSGRLGLLHSWRTRRSFKWGCDGCGACSVRGHAQIEKGQRPGLGGGGSPHAEVGALKPSLVNGAGLKILSRRSSRVRIPAPAPLPAFDPASPPAATRLGFLARKAGLLPSLCYIEVVEPRAGVEPATNSLQGCRSATELPRLT